MTSHCHDIRQKLSNPIGSIILQNARIADPSVPHGLKSCDIKIADGRIEAIAASVAASQTDIQVDLDHSLVLPTSVDCHTHIDKGVIWNRTGNPDNTFLSALTETSQDITRFQTMADVSARAEFMLTTAYAHGTKSLRSHVDASEMRFDETWEALQHLATIWEDRIELQFCPFTGLDVESDFLNRLAKLAEKNGSPLSLFLHPDPRIDAFLDQIFCLADNLGLALDFHVDETLDTRSLCLSNLIEAKRRNKFEGPVLAGHCCSLSILPDEELDRVLDQVAEAKIGVVTLPLCNSYLMDRVPGRTPRLRGVAPVKELIKRGIPTALASDNIRDPFHAYGDLDLLELFRLSLPGLHLDEDPACYLPMINEGAATLMGMKSAAGLKAGQAADLIITEGRNWSEFGARPLNDRIVIRDGRAIDAKPPTFRELDFLEGMHP